MLCQASERGFLAEFGNAGWVCKNKASYQMEIEDLKSHKTIKANLCERCFKKTLQIVKGGRYGLG